MTHIRNALAAASVLLLCACSTINPNTVINATRAHAAFPGLAIAVQECVADHPEVHDAIVPHFNILVGLWQEARQLDLDKGLLQQLGNAQGDVNNAREAWVFIRNTIVSNGIDCGPAVRAEADNIELIFADISGALKANTTVVEAARWVRLFGVIFGAGNLPRDIEPMVFHS